SALARSAKHPAGGRAMKADSVADPRIERGNDKRLGVGGESHMANKPFIENLVDGFAVIEAALRLAHNTRAFAWRDRFGHCSTSSEKTWRGASLFVAARLICSRRQIGMSEE